MTSHFFRHRALAFIISTAVALGLTATQAWAQLSTTTIGAGSLISLPASAQWQLGLNFLPANGDTVTLNPPQFQWSYATNYANVASDTEDKTFVFQVAYDPGFSQLAINAVTPWNFYNTIAPLSNSTCYWRVGYVHGVTNPLSTNVYFWSPTYTFTIASGAVVWDRSLLASPSYLAGKAQHPYILLNTNNRAAILNWLNTCSNNYCHNTTNRVEWDVGKAWTSIQQHAAGIITNSWWPSNYPPSSQYSLMVWAEYTYQVAFMHALTANPVWSNAHPEVALLLMANNYMTNGGAATVEYGGETYTATNGGWDMDPIYSSIDQYEGRGLALGYDWCYDLLNSTEQTAILQALAMRCQYVAQGSDLVWNEGNEPWYAGVGDPTGQYANGTTCAQYSLANFGRSHATDDFYLAMLQALAGYNENSWCANLFNMGVNYMTGPTYCFRNAMGVGRMYTQVHMGSDRVYTSQLTYASAFPEINWGINPFFERNADWWVHMEPVGYNFGHEPWGDTGYGQLNDWLYIPGRNMGLLTGDGRYMLHWWNQENWYIAQNHGPQVDDVNTITLPYLFNYSNIVAQMTPETNLALLYTNEGWMISSSASPSIGSSFTNGVGVVFQARPSGCVTGHDFFSDGSFQMWAYGAAVTDTGGGDVTGNICNYPHVPWAHDSLMVNGLGECQAFGQQVEPYYNCFIAYTNTPSFTYCAADLTRGYIRDNLYYYAPNMPPMFNNLYVPSTPAGPGPLCNVTNVTRQLLFNHQKYLVLFDTLQTAGPPTNMFSFVYHILEPTLSLNTNTMSFTYTATNRYSSNYPGITVYVSLVIQPSELVVTNMTGTNGSMNYRMNPFTGENWWTNLPGDLGDMNNQSDVLWFSSAQPTNNFHFMTVIYPVITGSAAPEITPLDDYTVAVNNGAQSDVICFNPNSTNAAAATILVNSPAIVSSAGAPPVVNGAAAPASSGGGGSPVTTPAPVSLSAPSGLFFWSPYNPTNIVPGYWAWWDPDTLRGTNGSPVASWTDSSAAARCAVQNNSASCPILNAAAQNGHNTLSFNGTSSYLAWPPSAGLLPQPLEVFMVLQPNQLINQMVALCNQSSSSYFECAYSGGSHSYTGYAGTYLLNNSTGTTNWVEATFIFNGTNSEVFVDSVPISTGNAGADGLNGVLIGCFQSLAGMFWNGQIGDIIIYPEILSTNNQLIVEHQLRSKYGF
ncbi:MAG: DUF4962 domain-containing protein [Limisphaerales bacterium]